MSLVVRSTNSFPGQPVPFWIGRRILQPCCDGTSSRGCWLILDKMVQDLATMHLVFHLRALRPRCDEFCTQFSQAALVSMLILGRFAIIFFRSLGRVDWQCRFLDKVASRLMNAAFGWLSG